MVKIVSHDAHQTKSIIINKKLTKSECESTNEIKTAEETEIIECKEKDSTISKKDCIDLFGLKINGISLDSFNQAHLNLSVPFNKGSYQIHSVHKDAQTKIKKGTLATISAHVSKHGKEVQCNSLSLKFTKPITIRNPAAAFLGENEQHGRKINKLIDRVADITFKSVEIDNQGNIHLDGKIFVFGKKFKSIASMMPPEMSNLNAMNNNAEQPKPNVSAFLKSIAPAMGTIFISAQMSSEPTEISVESRGVFTPAKDISIEFEKVSSEKAPLTLNFEARCNVDTQGSINIEVCRDHTKLKSGIARLSGGGHITLDNPTSSKRRYIHGAVDFSAKTRELKSEMKVMKEIKIPIQGKIQADAHVDFAVQNNKIAINDSSTVDVKGEVKLKTNTHAGAQGIELSVESAAVSVHGSSNFSVSDSNLNLKSGRAKIEATATKIAASAFGLKGYIDGTAHVAIDAKDISYTSNSMPTARGKIHTTYELSPETAEQYASMPSLENDIQFELHNTLNITFSRPLKTLTDFLPNSRSFEANPTRIVPLKTKAVGEIGSEALKNHVARLTHAPVRKNNSVKLLGEGNLSHKERLRLINEAKTSICYQTFVFKTDKSGTEILEALKEAAKRGVKVRVIVDSLGNIEPLENVVSEPKIYQQLREAGIEFRKYNPMLEEGMQELVVVLKKDFKKWDMFSPKDLTAFPTNIAIFKKIAEVSSGNLSEDSKNIEVTGEEKSQLIRALGKVLGRDDKSNPQAVIADLTQKFAGNGINLIHLLMISEPLVASNNRWHEKYFIVDGYTAILGDVNTADEYLLGGTGERVRINGKSRTAWKSIDVMINGEAAIDTYNNFCRNWKALNGDEMPVLQFDSSQLTNNEGTEVQIIQHHPLEDGDSNILNFLIENFKALKKGEKAFLEAGYFLPSGTQRKFMEAMIDAANRGADIRLLTNSATSSDSATLPNAAIFDKRELLAAGVRLFERTDDRTIHSKAFSFAGKVAVIGSYNLDNRSASSSSEGTAAIYNEKFALELEQHIATNMNDEKVKEVQLKDIASQPIFSELKSAGSSLLRDLL